MNLLNFKKKDKTDIVEGSEAKRKFEKLVTKQKYQNILTGKVLIEAEEALESTEALLKSVLEINIQMDKHGDIIDKTINVSSEVGAFSEEVCASVEESLGVVNESLDKANEGKEALEEIMESFLNIKSIVQKMSGAMNEVSKKSDEIKGIVDIIKQISKTTHLLSLNANIEAARAGEAGKGFGVVAKEVNKLASSSSESADSINRIIDQMTAVTDNTMRIVQEGVETVDESASAVEKSGVAFEKIITSIKRTEEYSNQINGVMGEQVDKNQYLISVIDELVSVSNSVKMFNENISVNADKQRALLKILEAAIKNLNEMAAIDEINDESDKKCFKMLASKPSIFDPARMSKAIIEDPERGKIFSCMHKGLTQFGIGTEVVGAIAKGWSVQEDNLTWEFSLRRGMKFHNGSDITAEDVKFSFERLLSKELDSSDRWVIDMIEGSDEFYNGGANHVRGITVVDRYNVRMKLKYPYNGFINNLAYSSCAIIPKGKESLDKIGLIGAGAFEFDSFTDKGLILRKFENYFLGKALIDKIEFCSGFDNALDEFIRGNLDYMGVRKENIDRLNKEGFKIEKDDCIACRYLVLNFRSKNPVIQNKSARQAINYAVDCQKIVDDVFGGMDSVSRGVFPNSLTYFKTGAYDRNIKKAKELMNKSGIRSGRLNIAIQKNNRMYEDIAGVLKESLRDINIEVNTITIEGNYLEVSSKNSNCDIFLCGWVGDSGTPDNFIQPIIDSNAEMNLGGYRNEEAIQLLNDAKKTKNPYKYYEIMSELEKNISEDCPWIFLTTICSTYAVNESIKGLKVHPLRIINFEDVWIEN